MESKGLISYDNIAGIISNSFVLNTNLVTSKRLFRDIVEESYPFVVKFLSYLPKIDYKISKLYYIDKLSQDQISFLYGISQAAVSRRLKFIVERLKFLFKMPSLNPIQVREDFIKLFPENLVQFAFFFYWENTQNRVKYFIETSQSGAANKFKLIIKFLESKIDVEQGASFKNEGDDEVKHLALIYFDYFNLMQNKSITISHLYKKYDSRRANALINGKSVLN